MSLRVEEAEQAPRIDGGKALSPASLLGDENGKVVDAYYLSQAHQ